MKKIISGCSISILLVSFIISCKSISKIESEEILTITHGTSFGNCRGYCIKTEIYSKEKVIYTQSSWQKEENPAITNEFDLQKEDFKLLSDKLDWDKWNKLDTVIACPDCTDRGSEFIIIQTKKSVKKIKFGAHSSVEGLNEVLEICRNKRKELDYIILEKKQQTNEK